MLRRTRATHPDSGCKLCSNPNPHHTHPVSGCNISRWGQLIHPAGEFCCRTESFVLLLDLSRKDLTQGGRGKGARAKRKPQRDKGHKGSTKKNRIVYRCINCVLFTKLPFCGKRDVTKRSHTMPHEFMGTGCWAWGRVVFLPDGFRLARPT
jgi:hypothetical protein